MPRLTRAVILALGLAGALVVGCRTKTSGPVPEHSSTKGASQAKPTPVPEPALSSAGSGVPVNNAADSGAPPSLPDDAPDRVSFGVVLVAYRGAELAADDAPPKAVALAKARALVEGAKRDFAETVKKGDHGSTEDAGIMPRGVLEPKLEYILFTLKKGEVYGEPLDTPRGYWIVRRNVLR
jgi:hypothetical protein